MRTIFLKFKVTTFKIMKESKILMIIDLLKNVDELTFCRLMKQIAQEKSGLRETPYG
jgi:hypothetical protein